MTKPYHGTSVGAGFTIIVSSPHPDVTKPYHGTSVGAGFTIIVSSPHPDVTKPAPIQ
ncbi:hypothetical protein [Coleofasciculus sp. E1-EBD-02]|uniref:hypothetical protein n=1 Tax=Coleofasciculus sp. E1-EBD-02 TaxID=3068481 RepID=UPI0032FAB943